MSRRDKRHRTAGALGRSRAPAKHSQTQRRTPKFGAAGRGVESLTVGWMVSVVTTLICDLAAAISRLYVVWINPATRLELLSNVLWFAAAVLGLITLFMTPIILKSRREPPPTPILILAIVVAGVPLLAVLVSQVR